MASSALDKLSKVLALADSGHDGEALAAFRTARNLLDGDGVSLSEVLRTALDERSPEFVKVRGGVVATLQKDVLALQTKVRDLQRQLRERQQDVHYWKKLAEENAAGLKKAASDKACFEGLTKNAMLRLADILREMEEETETKTR